MTLDFGFVLPKVSVGNFVWIDTDRDGVQDVGEPGISGATLTITKADGSAATNVFGAAVTTTTTDANGAYVFADLPAGSYKVTATTPSGYIATTALAGSDRAVDSSTGNATSTNLTVDGSSDMTLDFGFVLPKVSVGNFVWVDTDRDGVQDVGEPGISGATLSITKADGSAVTNVFGAAVTTTTTDINGAYVFADLPVGSYKVTATNPAGYVPTAALAGSDRALDSSTGNATSTNLTVDGSSDMTLDFGFVSPYVSVGDLVWFDTDRDGVQDAGEPGIAGVTLSITKADGTAVTNVFGRPVTTTTTNSTGLYLFDNLPFGSYKVTVTNPTGYTATTALAGSDRAVDSSTGNATSTNLTTNGASDLTLDFGFTAPRVSVGNLVWFDTNHDGVQDVNESGIAGAVLTLTKMDGTAVTNVFGNTVGPITTDTTGRFLFDNLPIGQYKVSITSPAGFTSTLVGSGTSGTDSAAGTDTSVNMTNDGDSDMTLDFGFYPIAVSVGDYVWFDLNADGIQDATEAGIAGVTLSITKTDGSPVTDVVGNAVTTTATNAAGKYLFSNLPPGSYRVTVVPPSGFIPTTTGSGTGATDSSTGSADSVVLPNNLDADLTLDFGFRLPRVSIGNYVWFDKDKDGIQDRNEKGIAGVSLSVVKADGSPVADVFGNSVTTTTTDTVGLYSFRNLPIGSYRVTVVPPAGYCATLSGVGSVETDSSELTATSVNLTIDGASDMTLDFGFCVEKKVAGQSNPITPPRKAVTPPETEFVFAASVLGKPSKGAEFIPSKTVIAGRDSEEWEKNVKVSGGVWKVIDGKVTFKPNPGFKGTVSVKYQVTDTSGKVAESTLTVTVTEQKELPATGSSPQPLLLVAFSLLLLGVFLIMMRRRLL
jgi:LPXTG-motif cell wall-anchored protein